MTLLFVNDICNHKMTWRSASDTDMLVIVLTFTTCDYVTKICVIFGFCYFPIDISLYKKSIKEECFIRVPYSFVSYKPIKYIKESKKNKWVVFCFLSFIIDRQSNLVLYLTERKLSVVFQTHFQNFQESRQRKSIYSFNVKTNNDFIHHFTSKLKYYSLFAFKTIGGNKSNFGNCRTYIKPFILSIYIFYLIPKSTYLRKKGLKRLRHSSRYIILF